MMMEADLEARQAVHWETVEVALLGGEDEYREGLGHEVLRDRGRNQASTWRSGTASRASGGTSSAATRRP